MRKIRTFDTFIGESLEDMAKYIDRPSIKFIVGPGGTDHDYTIVRGIAGNPKLKDRVILWNQRGGVITFKVLADATPEETEEITREIERTMKFLRYNRTGGVMEGMTYGEANEKGLDVVSYDWDSLVKTFTVEELCKVASSAYGRHIDTDSESELYNFLWKYQYLDDFLHPWYFKAHYYNLYKDEPDMDDVEVDTK